MRECIGVIPVRPSTPGTVIGALFTHNEGYSTMCGHATIALGRWLIESGSVTATAPRDAVCARAAVRHRPGDVPAGRRRVISTAFDSVPAFLSHRDVALAVDGLGTVCLDIAYGAHSTPSCTSSTLGLDFFHTPIADLVRAASAITDAVRASVPVTHPEAEDLGFLYGTILTDDAPVSVPTYNLCVFAEGSRSQPNR